MRLLALKIVLVATDLDDSSQPAITAARALSAAADAELHVVNVTPTAAADSTGVHELLGRLGIGLDEASVHAVAGDPALAIGRLADQIYADVIVLGPHRDEAHQDGGAGRPIDTALAIATNSAAPCLVAHDLTLPLTRVVVAVDLSETSRGALLVGLSWASALRSTGAAGGTALTALYVSSSAATADELMSAMESLESQIEELREDAGSWANVVVQSDVVTGDDVAGTVARYADDHAADLLVLGTRGLGLDAVGRIGSVAAAVARKTSVPTVLVPPAIWLELGQIRSTHRAQEA
jgi:nucleotide-binding universal stress UspA family protein